MISANFSRVRFSFSLSFLILCPISLLLTSNILTPGLKLFPTHNYFIQLFIIIEYAKGTQKILAKGIHLIYNIESYNLLEGDNIERKNL